MRQRRRFQIIDRPPSTGVVICGPDSYFRDDVRATCSACGAAIVHRPEIPAGATKICMPCGIARHAEKPQAAFAVTRRTIAEIAAHLARRGKGRVQ